MENGIEDFPRMEKSDPLLLLEYQKITLTALITNITGMVNFIERMDLL
jgi:hypothetical protein